MSQTSHLPALPQVTDCWNQIGVFGDRSCPELTEVVHCHNCPVFAQSARRLLDLEAPPDYLQHEIERLVLSPASEECDVDSLLIFRLGAEWLALPVSVLIEVYPVCAVHSIPHWEGLLAGLVNVRGELQLCVLLDHLLGIPGAAQPPRRISARGSHADVSTINQQARYIVAQWNADRWVFPVDEVDRVHRTPVSSLTEVPGTLARAGNRFSRGVLSIDDRKIGRLDEARLFAALRERLKP